MWASLYDDESKASELIHDIHDNYFLVSIVENNFVNGNIWDIFDVPKSCDVNVTLPSSTPTPAP
jgi:methylenetetrahydrofolate reductase (NADPH)